jgi:hypothetical protein
MIITITPDDLIKRCLWTEYRRFCLKDKNETELAEIVNENLPVKLTEEDAFVIGLIKVIETENLIHRFNLELEDILRVKSTIQEDMVLINKSSALRFVLEFKDRFPIYYKPNEIYKKAIEDLFEYVNERYKEINVLKIYNILVKQKMITYVRSQDVKKLIEGKKQKAE